ncbi:MAG: hypothetical protein IPJ20_20545 [Flammeovirgaceae bacterium]|nr:hypothetical protein [Flammeovirgaceae bacterium]
MYQLFSRLSLMTNELRNYGVQSGEISRASQYVSKMIITFDNMKIIHNYRTPITLRTYSKVFIYIFQLSTAHILPAQWVIIPLRLNM